MSRVAKNPINIPSTVTVTVKDGMVTMQAGNTILTQKVHPAVQISFADNMLKIAAKNDQDNSIAHAGTTRALLHNMMLGLSQGFEKKLALVGVGYRAQMKGKVLALTLGFSHPIEYELPAGIVAETPSQTEIVVKGANKQLVGQVAAKIRSFRPPEPYKGKGVCYVGEHIVRKEGKKK